MVVTAIWMSLALSGYGLVDSVTAQRVAGYPNEGQINYYIIFPNIMAATASCAGICIWFGRFNALAYTALVLAFAALFPYLLGYTGGV